MIRLPEERAEQHGVFTSWQASDSGLSRHQVQQSLSSGQLLAVRRGVYVERSSYDAMSAIEQAGARAVAACLVWSGSVISHHSAVILHDLPMLEACPWRPALTVPRTAVQHGHRNRTVEIRTATLPAEHVERRGAWSITTVARTICDVAVDGTEEAAIVRLDAGLARRLVTIDQLGATIESFAGRAGHQRLRDAARRADAGAESPPETVARLRLTTLGLRPRTQIWAHDHGGPIGAGDLWIQDLWSYLEVDGDVKYLRPQTATPLVDEKLRQERLEEAGFGVARIRARDAGDVRVISRRLHRASQRAASIRSADTSSLGWVGPPPSWARRGSAIDRAGPPPEVDIRRVLRRE